MREGVVIDHISWRGNWGRRGGEREREQEEKRVTEESYPHSGLRIWRRYKQLTQDLMPCGRRLAMRPITNAPKRTTNGLIRWGVVEWKERVCKKNRWPGKKAQFVCVEWWKTAAVTEQVRSGRKEWHVFDRFINLWWKGDGTAGGDGHAPVARKDRPRAENDNDDDVKKSCFEKMLQCESDSTIFPTCCAHGNRDLHISPPLGTSVVCVCVGRWGEGTLNFSLY